MRTGRVWAVVAAIGLSGGTLAACGSGTHRVTVDNTPLANAYRATQAARSAKVKLDVRVTTASSSQAVAESGSGAFAWKPLAGQMNITVNVAGQKLTLPARIVGSTVYIQLPAAAAPQLGGKTWLGLDLSGLSTSSSFAGVDPSQELSLLEAQAQSVTKVGTETVNGIATTHYRAIVDLKKTGNLGPEGKQMVQQLAGAGVATMPTDVWIDSAGRPAQIEIVITVPRAPSGVSGAAAAAFPETTHLTMDFSDWGTAVQVTAPPASQVDSMTWQQLQQLSGA